MCHEWPVKNAIVHISPIRLTKNSKYICGNSLCLLGTQNKDMGTSITAGVRLHLRHRLHIQKTIR